MEERKRLPDTPWHVGYAKKEENDPRRHKSRCIYKQNKICHNGKSAAYMLKCPGSSHCKFYAESENMAEEVYFNTRTAEEERADNMKDMLFAGKAKIEKEIPTTKVKKKISKPAFTGIEYIRLSELKVPAAYFEWSPKPEDVDRLLAFYEEHRKMDSPILVCIKDGEYCLKDGYLQYYVSRKLNKKWIKSTMNKKLLVK